MTRVRFLSSFLASSALVWANDQNECAASEQVSNNNPRYIDQELQMKYGENKGAFQHTDCTTSTLYSTYCRPNKPSHSPPVQHNIKMDNDIKYLVR